MALTFGNPEAQGRYQGWYNAATSMGLPADVAERIAGGGIRWAEENEPDKHPGWSGADLSGYAANTLNPAQALSFYRRGGRPDQYQWSGRADVGGNARNLTSITPPGTAPEDAARYIADWNSGGWGAPAPGVPATPGGTATTTGMYDFLGRHLDPTQQLFYQTNPQLAYAYGGTVFSPNAASPRRDWWDQNWGQFNAEYGNASVDNPNLQITDFLNQRFPQIAQAYNLLPAQMRGESNPYLAAGRPQL